MKPRFASSVVTLDGFCRAAFDATPDEWKRLPPQWRGFVLNHSHQGFTTAKMLEKIQTGEVGGQYDPQGTFDSFLGHAPS